MSVSYLNFEGRWSDVRISLLLSYKHSNYHWKSWFVDTLRTYPTTANKLYILSMDKTVQKVVCYFFPRCMECQRGLTMRKVSVWPPVCLSVKRVEYDQTEERCVRIFIPHERSFSLVYWEEQWLVGATPYTWNFVSTGPRWSEIADFQPIFAHSASAVTPSEKSSINANRKSTTRFPVSLRWSSYVAKPPKGDQKRKTAVFHLKSYFVWRKSATKFLCMKTVSNKVVRHSLA